VLFLPALYRYDVRSIDEVKLVEGGIDGTLHARTTLRLFHLMKIPVGVNL